MKQTKIIGALQKLLAVGAIVFIVLTGCKKSFLEVDPQGQQKGTTFWTTATDAAQAVNAMYANLRNYNEVAFPAIAIESLGSDDAEKGSAPNDASFMNQYDNFTVTSTQDQLNLFWTGQYQEINLCNQILDHVDTMAAVDAGAKTRYIAEAKFIRAYSYFRLVRAFGSVPLRLHLPKDASEYNIPRTDTNTVWNAIEQDLADAATILPVTVPASEYGRATKGAALSLHAKVAMYRKNWGDVLNYTNQVIALGVYSLFPDYEQLFREQNENSSESIFEIQCALIIGNGGSSNSQYSEVQGMRGNPDAGWGFNVPTPALVASYETGDPRKDATILFRGETTPEGDAIPPAGDNPMYNQKSYVPFSTLVNGYTKGAQQNIRVIRYAEVLLMNAEAANELGNATLAKQSLNAVRERARAGNNAILPDVTTTDQATLRTAIWDERHVELAMEFDRYFDVIRQGRAAQIFGPKGWTARNMVWPIPQNEIDLSAGVLTQNPGY
jgi:hypothetical protein